MSITLAKSRPVSPPELAKIISSYLAKSPSATQQRLMHIRASFIVLERTVMSDLNECWTEAKPLLRFRSARASELN
jgi:hypothetical protein